jgi:nucleoside-diphosphate-sugar epimerase
VGIVRPEVTLESLPASESHSDIQQRERSHQNPDIAAFESIAAVVRTQNNEDDIWRANLDGMRNLIAAAVALTPQSRFVMASTGLVYDADASHPGLEDEIELADPGTYKSQ